MSLLRLLGLLIFSVTVAETQPRIVRVHNRTGQLVVALYVTEGAEVPAARNQIGAHALPPNAVAIIELEPGYGCVYDVTLILASNKLRRRRGVDVCTFHDVYFY